MKKVLGILALLLVLWVYLAVSTADPWYNILGSKFLGPNNIENLLRRTAMFGLLGIGVAFVIIHSGIDLSIGSMVCLSAALLALFLRVDYQPFHSLPVSEVRAGQQLIALPVPSAGIEVGDPIRFEGGSRARDALLTVTGVRVDGQQTMLSVQGVLTNDDSQGVINKSFRVREFTAGDLSDRRSPLWPTMTLEGRHPELRPRDRLHALHSSAGVKELRIVSVQCNEATTRLQLRDDLGQNFTDQWVILPLERRQRMPIPIAILAVLAIALGLGLIHGLLVTGLRLPPFVVTLCGLLIYRGIARWMVNDQPVGFLTEYDDTLQPLATGRLVLWQHLDQSDNVVNSFGIPVPFLILIVVALIAAVFLNKTIWGRYLLALGRNEEAARYSGINTARIVVLAYMICTVLAAIGGMLWGLDSNSVSPSSFGSFFELYAIAAAVLGGCSLRGGEGSIVGVLIGTAVMQTLNNMIVLSGIPDTLEFAIIGSVILIGVIADELLKRWAAHRRAKMRIKD